MILHELTANKSSFHPIRFKEGLNVILADTSDASKDNDTRNGVGKTSLIEILAFCLGGAAIKGKGIVQDALQSWIFTLEMTIKDSRVKITRSVANPATIRVSGDISAWNIKPDHTEILTGEHVYGISRWQNLLGWALFGFDYVFHGKNDVPVPSGMLSCFLRVGQRAYQNVDSHNLHRTDGKERTNLAYLLGLDWEFIGRIKELRNDLRRSCSAKKIVEDGAFPGASGDIEKIRLERSKIHEEISELEHALASYDFSPQYERLEEEVNNLTKETLSLSNRIATEKRRSSIFRTAIQEEQDVSRGTIENLYRETGLVFPEDLRRTLDEVLEFHQQIVLNRRAFLGDEIERMHGVIQDLTKARDEKSKTKGEKTTQLAAQDRFGDLRNRQERLSELKSQEKRHDEWISDLEGLDRKIKELGIEIKAARSTAKADFEERKGILARVHQDFEAFTRYLYGKAGTLNIVPENDEYSISVDMEKGGSEGVRMMGIFCFDLALLKNQSRFHREISFLVHDTPIFDAVDGRQRALAIELAAREAESIHGQYICTMNSDKVPQKEFPSGFDFDASVVLRLSDAKTADSLLGIHFEVDR